MGSYNVGLVFLGIFRFLSSRRPSLFKRAESFEYILSMRGDDWEDEDHHFWL